MKKFLAILCLAFSLSSCGKDTHRFQNYPEIITKYQLEDLHDRAKWEVYKLNALYGPACLVNFGKHWHLNIGMLCYSIIFDKEGEILMRIRR
jgi:hypothetical protein